MINKLYILFKNLLFTLIFISILIVLLGKLGLGLPISLLSLKNVYLSLALTVILLLFLIYQFNFALLKLRMFYLKNVSLFFKTIEELSNLKENKLLVRVLVLSLSLITVFLFFYSNLKQEGNFFSLSQPIKFSAKNNGPLMKGQKINFEFISKENNLGSVFIRINTFNRTNNDILVFKIKESEASDWHYVEEYPAVQFRDNELYPLGFPLITNSKNKKIQVEIESLSGTMDDSVGISSIYPNTYAKYVFQKSELLYKLENLTSFLFTKVSTTIINTGLSFLLVIPLIILINIALLKQKTKLLIIGFIGLLIFNGFLEKNFLVCYDKYFPIRINFSDSLRYCLNPLFFVTGFIIIVQFLESIRTSSYFSSKRKKQIKISSSYLTWGILLTIFLSAFFLRILKLDNLEPYVDEYVHLNRAQSMATLGKQSVFINGQILPKYTRAYFLTYIVSILFKLFNKSLFIARLPSVIASALTVFPLFFLGRKINNTVGIFCAFLWALSPWSIAVSRNVREYAFFPFFFALILLFVINFEDHLIKLFERKIKIGIKTLLFFILFLLPLIYGFVIDPLSTFKQIILIYCVFSLIFTLSFLHSSSISYKIKKAFVLFIMAFIGVASLWLVTIKDSSISIKPVFSNYWLQLLLGNSDTQWFFNSGILGYYFVFALGLIFSLLLWFKNKLKASGYFLLSFAVYLYFFSFHFARYFRPRYGFMLLLWIIPLVSVGLYYTLFWMIRNFSKCMALVLFMLLFILIINPLNVLTVYSMKNGGYAPITNEIHYKYLPVLEKYGSQIVKEDVVICSICETILWYNQIPLNHNNLFIYNYTDTQRFDKVQRIISKNEHGWLILDFMRNGQWAEGYPPDSFTIEDKTIKFLELFSSFYIYKW